MQIALTGDVMLGRLVDQQVIRDPAVRPASLWGDVLPIMRGADLRCVNLECTISSVGREWHPHTKAFHFRAHPRAIDFLRAAGIDAVTLANNHILDYGVEALADCLALLDRAGIKHVGSGMTSRSALQPCYLQSPMGRVAVVALTDNEPEWEATEKQAGVAYMAYDERGLTQPSRRLVAQVVHGAKRQAPWLIVSAHVGPNWGAPSAGMRALAHDLIDLGADLYWGHSNHTPQGIERYRGKIILYSSGDFIDDYMVDEDERNDLSFLFVCEAERGREIGLRLYPIRIEDCRVRRAVGEDERVLQKTMQEKCAVFGTTLSFTDGVGWLRPG